MSLQPQAASLQESAAPLRKLAARGPGRSWSVGENGVNVVVFVFVLVYLPAQSLRSHRSVLFSCASLQPRQSHLDSRGTRTPEGVRICANGTQVRQPNHPYRASLVLKDLLISQARPARQRHLAYGKPHLPLSGEGVRTQAANPNHRRNPVPATRRSSLDFPEIGGSKCLRCAIPMPRQ